MQTFLPYPDYAECAKVIDDKRLWKQVLEAKQILATIRGDSKAWGNHPAVTMWRGYHDSLRGYLMTMVQEWLNRRIGDGISLEDYWVGDKSILCYTEDDIPHWIEDERLHSSHRSNLLRKDPVWYGQFGWVEPDDMPYYWPSCRGCE